MFIKATKRPQQQTKYMKQVTKKKYAEQKNMYILDLIFY